MLLSRNSAGLLTHSTHAHCVLCRQRDVFRAIVTVVLVRTVALCWPCHAVYVERLLYRQPVRDVDDISSLVQSLLSCLLRYTLVTSDPQVEAWKLDFVGMYLRFVLGIQLGLCCHIMHHTTCTVSPE